MPALPTPDRVLGLMPESLCTQLRRFAFGRVCVVGVGNRERGDDGVGCRVVDALRGHAGAMLVEAGEVPENHLERVVRARPNAVLMVDAVDLGAAPGVVRLLPPQTLVRSGLSTHATSLSLCADYIAARTGAAVAVVAIQPADLTPGAQLSGAVACAVTEVCDALARALAANR